MAAADGAAAILVEQDGHLAVLTLNRPERLNAIDAPMAAELAVAMAAALDDDGIRAVLIAANGRAFCAGTDLPELLASQASDLPAPGGEILRSTFNPMIEHMANAGKPIVAAVNGAAAGVGCALALAADIVLMGRTATLIQAFVRIGAVPDAGTTWLLPRIVGHARAKQLMLLGDAIPAEAALDWGLAYRLVDDAALASEARGVATQLANGPPQALAAIKRLAHDSHGNDLPTQMAAEAAAQDRLFRTADLREGARAFVNRTQPRFSGR